MKETSPDNESLSPRTRDASSKPPKQRKLPQGESAQLKEDRFVLDEESDQPIVVRDGKTDYKAKGLAGGQSNQSTNATERKAPTKSASSSLIALNRKAEKEPECRFRDLYRLLSLQALYESFGSLKRNAAPGVDGVTWQDYEANLDENLEGLLARLKEKRYRAPHVKRSYIPKGGGRMRPLGLPTLEDKIVQHAASRILESIYEADFSDRSRGYRRGQLGARESSQELSLDLNTGRYRWVVEADIRSFFEEVDHDWLTKMLEQRIDDRAFMRLIRKWLKAGVLDPLVNPNQAENSEAGTPQGGIVSPMLANIYLHYVLDLWIEKVVKKRCQGAVIFMRYADDIIVGFEKQSDAEHYLEQLPKRLEKFNLQLAEEKSSSVKFHRWEPETSGSFTFLGYDFYWSPTKKNPKNRVVKRKTNKKKLRASLRAMKDWIKESRSWPLKMILSSLRRRLRGYWNYYCVIANHNMTSRYMKAVSELMFKWLNRRSQRKSYTWSEFNRHWKGDWQIPRPQVVEKWVNQRDSQSEIPLVWTP